MSFFFSWNKIWQKDKFHGFPAYILHKWNVFERCHWSLTLNWTIYTINTISRLPFHASITLCSINKSSHKHYQYYSILCYRLSCVSHSLNDLLDHFNHLRHIHQLKPVWRSRKPCTVHKIFSTNTCYRLTVPASSR